MTRIERVVKEISDLRDFYLKLQKTRGREASPPDRARDTRDTEAAKSAERPKR